LVKVIAELYLYKEKMIVMRWLYLLMLLIPAVASAGEDCSMFNGTCREVCGAGEEAEKGAFLDCSDKQECCVKKEAVKDGERNIPPDSKDREQKSKTGK
jgi:hypothetical protein